MDSNKTEAQLIKEEVAKRKKIAKDKGVDKLISDLYFSSIEYFPSWIKNNKEDDGVWLIVTEASRSKEKDEKKNRDKKITEIVLNGGKYKFVFEENSFTTPDNDYHIHGLLELFLYEKKVLALNTAFEHSDYDSTWSCFGIEAFIDGDWVNDF